MSAKANVKMRGCQACRGRGGFVDVIADGQGPFETCGYCRGTGEMTPEARGRYLAQCRYDKWLTRTNAAIRAEIGGYQ